ncbi:MAG: NAD kinase [Alphaproteobacteria bacterium]|nr:NAD kinase [Alphaproteobacteria bacterium]
MKLGFFAGRKPRAQKALEELTSKYGKTKPEEADTIIVLGGDGTMLRALHTFADYQAPLYGLNLGTLGFLLNHQDLKDDLEKRIEEAKRYTIRPLIMEAVDKSGKKFKELAFNEVSLIRETHNSAKIKIHVNNEVRIKELVCDGVLVSTTVGSTAYNSSAGGPILPLEANILAMTPISAFRPRRWPGALLRNNAKIKFEILHAIERPVSATADSKEARDVKEVKVRESKKISKTILFDPENPLQERVFKEQFFN